ncbi:hypothetical protein [Microbacterium dauci]|uniref:Uncharacterized protein n=1 Tax=Microbacterium dauci TaxID=3048008 RepID=A0ABT6ZDQ8_9MICO|nr:hypothetical protein [Microbacterium sp. LX3-4]MDJ1114295.1 hypothetical protein [Microbacterium sp. LX3-4]
MTASALTRSWPALAAWGAGLLDLGLGAGAVTQGADPASRGVGVLLVFVGTATLAWGVAALATGRLVLPRLTTGGSLVAIAAVVAALALDPQGVSALAVASALLLTLVVGIAAALTVRRAARSEADATPAASAAREPRRTSMIGLIAGCIVVAGLVTPSLGSTAVGSDAPSHSDHELVLPGHGGH